MPPLLADGATEPIGVSPPGVFSVLLPDDDAGILAERARIGSDVAAAAAPAEASAMLTRRVEVCGDLGAFLGALGRLTGVCRCSR